MTMRKPSLIVRLFKYAADNNGSVSLDEGVEHFGCSSGLIFSRGRYRIPSESRYRGRDPILLEYITKMKAHSSRKPRTERTNAEPIAETADTPRPGYPTKAEVLGIVGYSYMTGGNGDRYIVERKDLAAHGGSQPLISFMKGAKLILEVERDKFIATGTLIIPSHD